MTRICALWLLSLWLGFSRADPLVEVNQRDNVFQVTASLSIAAERGLVWQVLTDYPRYPEIFPNVRATQVLERRGNRLVLEQRGESQLLFLTIPLDTVLEIEEFAPERMRCNSIAGTLRLQADIELKNEGNSTRLWYRATITLQGWAPASIVQRDVTRQLEAIRRESLRRCGARQSGC